MIEPFFETRMIEPFNRSFLPSCLSPPSIHYATQLVADSTREKVAGHGRSGRPRAPAVALHGGRAGRALPRALRGLQPRRAAAHPAGRWRGWGGRTRAGLARRRRLPQRLWRRAGTHRAGEATEAGARVCTHSSTPTLRDVFAPCAPSGAWFHWCLVGVVFFIWFPLFATWHCPFSGIFSEVLWSTSPAHLVSPSSCQRLCGCNCNSHTHGIETVTDGTETGSDHHGSLLIQRVTVNLISAYC